MSHGFLPRTDPELLSWARNFAARISASPADYGLTPEQAADFSSKSDAFNAAMLKVQPQIRNMVSVSAKNAARRALKTLGASLGKTVQANLAVTDKQKIDLGLTVSASRTATPAPADAPVLSIESVQSRTVNVKLGRADVVKRGKPPGVSGAVVFSFIGEEPPTSLAEWKFEAIVAKTSCAITFSSTYAMGTRVWLTAVWFSHRKDTGPACNPVGTYLQGGGVETSSLRLAA